MDRKRLTDITVAVCIIFSIGMTATAGMYITYGREDAGNTTLSGNMVSAGQGQQAVGMIKLPLPKDTQGSQVSVNAVPENRVIHINLKNVDNTFFYTNPVGGDTGLIEMIQYGGDGNEAGLDLHMNGAYECESSLEEDGLHISVVDIRKAYKCIVALRLEHMGQEDTGTVAYGVKESDVIEEFAGYLKEYLKEQDIYAMIIEPQTDISGLDYDYLVGVHCNANEHSRVDHGLEVEYSENGGEECKELADNIFTEVSLADSSCVGLAGGVKAISSAKGSTVSKDKAGDGINIGLGYLTNKKEALNLDDDEYLSNMAKAVSKGIVHGRESGK